MGTLYMVQAKKKKKVHKNMMCLNSKDLQDTIFFQELNSVNVQDKAFRFWPAFIRKTLNKL